MVGCDMCFKWYHTKCIDFDDRLADVADYFHCTSCIGKKFKPVLNYWCYMQHKKINKGNTSVMDINEIMSNFYDKGNHVNTNALNSLAFPSRKIQSLIIKSDEISIFSNKGLPNINSCCWLNSCFQGILDILKLLSSMQNNSRTLKLLSLMKSTLHTLKLELNEIKCM